jgi:hypothetical protein
MPSGKTDNITDQWQDVYLDEEKSRIASDFKERVD